MKGRLRMDSSVEEASGAERTLPGTFAGSKADTELASARARMVRDMCSTCEGAKTTSCV